MADVGSLLDLDQFSCSICLELLKDPVSILCGHSFCMVCINGCWDQEDKDGTYSCPQCRQPFTPRPAVRKNTILADVVEKLKETQPQDALPSGPEDVKCDFCTESKNKAVKSCLVCLASYCETHLQPHYESPAFKKHKLVKASRRLQEQICSQHDKLLEVYCRTDQQCICTLCMLDDHKGHVVGTVASEKSEKQVHLQETQKKCEQKLQERKKELQALADVVEAHKRSAQTAVKNIEKICAELISFIERRCFEVTKQIQEQKKAAVSQAEEVMEQLEWEIAQLKRRNAELEDLSHTEDSIHFLQTYHSLLAQPQSTDPPTITFNPLFFFEDVEMSVSQIKDKVVELCHEEFRNTTNTVQEIQIIPIPEPQSREEFLQYTTCFTLDPNTANQHLCLSEENKVVTCSEKDQSYPDHPDRFDYFLQVLCRESVSGRCYWEVEWSGNIGVCIAVSYKSISRKGRGDKCWFGRNDQSWRLFCSSSGYSYRHIKKETKIPIMPSSSRIGVYVDYRAGTLSFYSVSDTMKLLHRVQTMFTQPLYPGFVVSLGSKVKL